MRLLEHVERRPAFPGHVGERRPGLGRVEQPDAVVGGSGAQKPLRIDPLLRLLPHVHQSEPALAIAANRVLHGIVRRTRLPLHRRLEVGVGVRQKPMPLLLGIEEIGQGHDLLLKRGEFLAGFVHAVLMPRPLHEKRRQARECAEPE